MRARCGGRFRGCWNSACGRRGRRVVVDGALGGEGRGRRPARGGRAQVHGRLPARQYSVPDAAAAGLWMSRTGRRIRSILCGRTGRWSGCGWRRWGLWRGCRGWGFGRRGKAQVGRGQAGCVFVRDAGGSELGRDSLRVGIKTRQADSSGESGFLAHPIGRLLCQTWQV